MQSRLQRARGMALLIVLVVLVLIATLATEIAVTSRTHYQLADHSMEDMLLRTAVDGRVNLLKAALRFDGTNGSGYDSEADEWSWHEHETLSSWGERGTSNFGEVTGDAKQGSATFKNSDIEIVAWCEDERSKVNLRGLRKPHDGALFQHTRDLLVRVIDLYRETRSDLDLSDGDGTEMVDELVKWLDEEGDTENNPMPAVKGNRLRLLSVDDLLRVPGGHWTIERLYDVKDPDATDEDGGARVEDSSSADGAGGDTSWERQNGIPGLARYLTVFAEDAADPPMRVNVNTASLVVMKALFDENDEDLAEKLVTHRREGALEQEEAEETGTAAGATEAKQGFFKAKQDLTKVDGIGDDLAKYPRLNFFAEFSSSVYSLRIIAKALRDGGGSEEESDETGPKEVNAVYDYRAVVQRGTAGFLTLFVERRSDPIYDR